MNNFIYASNLCWESCEKLENNLYTYRLRNSNELRVDVDFETGKGYLWSNQIGHQFIIEIAIYPESLIILKNGIQGGNYK